MFIAAQLPDLGLSRKKKLFCPDHISSLGKLHPKTRQCGILRLGLLASTETILEGHSSFSISENIYCDCITTQFLPTLSSSASLTLYRCVSWEHPTKISTYQSQSLKACVLGKPTCARVKLSLSLEREKGGWDLGQEWEKVNRQSVILFSVILFSLLYV